MNAIALRRPRCLRRTPRVPRNPEHKHERPQVLKVEVRCGNSSEFRDSNLQFGSIPEFAIAEDSENLQLPRILRICNCREFREFAIAGIPRICNCREFRSVRLYGLKRNLNWHIPTCQAIRTQTKPQLAHSNLCQFPN